jgi:hypothetical protein
MFSAESGVSRRIFVFFTTARHGAILTFRTRLPVDLVAAAGIKSTSTIDRRGHDDSL